MDELAQAMRDLEEQRVYDLVDEKIKANVAPIEIVKVLNDGMVAVGQLFSERTYFISQLLYSAEILENVMNKLKPLLAGAVQGGSAGKVIIGTVKGDIHDIGKNIVVTLLRGAGFEVIDLGVDVPADKFISAVKESGAKVVGLSALLNLTYPEMKNVVDAMGQAGIRDKVKIIVGGTPVNEQVREYAGADFYAEDAVAGVNICKKIYAA
jgi:methylmalonyl-CoA mutase cobalamin-binding domain/chain